MQSDKSIQPREILNPFLVLPPEILGIILENTIYPSKSFIMLILASKSLRLLLLSAVKYVKSLDVLDTEQNKVLNRFTGIRHLTIQDKYVRLQSFDKNSQHSVIWRNLESLSIQSSQCLDMYDSGYLDLYLDQQSEQLESKYYMPSLRSLSIYSDHFGIDQDEYNYEDDIKIKADIFPSLRSLEIVNCNIINLSDFQNIQELTLVRSYRFDKQLSNIRISKLTISNDDSTDWSIVSIPSLKCLTLIDTGIGLSEIEHLNIEELYLEHVYIDDLEFDLEEIPVINSLLRLTITCNSQANNIIHINSRNFPNLIYLRLEYCNGFNISASSLREIVIVDCTDISVDEKLLESTNIRFTEVKPMIDELE